MSPDGVMTVWLGGIMEDQQDASGLLYRRNRYYDPSTGRFTQEDPIGLAGGLNLYGFAGGDPVTYGDPFGLCPTDLVKPNGKCPGDLSHSEYNRIEDDSRHLSLQAGGRIRSMLVDGKIVRVQHTNGQPAGAQWRNGTIEVTARYFTGLDAEGKPMNGYGTPHERAWVLAHELGHLVQDEAGMLISEIGTGVQPNQRRIRSYLQAHSGEKYKTVQADANAYACAHAVNPGAWVTPYCQP